MARGVKYAFVDGVVAIPNAKKADPQKIGEALAKVEGESNGLLKPRAVWKAAEGRPRHVLYRHFEWKDVEAAGHWRDQQARILINTIRVVDADDGDKGPAYFNLTQVGSGRAYRSYGDVMANADLQQVMLIAAERDMNAWATRYSELKEICELLKPARKRLSEMGKRRKAA